MATSKLQRPQHILCKSEEEAEKVFLQYLDVFGDDYYVELQRHGIPEQDKVNEVLLRFAAKHNVKVIATNDSHYVNQQDAEAQDILLCLQTGKDYNDPRRMRFDIDQFYFKNKEGVWEWSTADKSLKFYVENYFKGRKEDDFFI